LRGTRRVAPGSMPQFDRKRIIANAFNSHDT
jgi:hypothetical protein